MRLKEVLRLLRNRGIEGVPFKGPVLAQEVFGDVALRQFTDLDVLVPREASWAAVKALEAQGFVPEISLTHAQFRSYAARNKSLPMVNPESGVPLDLHWDLSGDYARAPMTVDSFKAELEPVDLLGTTFVTLGKKDLFIYLCLHATMESWSRLDHLCCVAELVQRQPEVLCPETLERARQLHLRRCFLTGCSLIHSVLDAPVPGVLLDRIGRDGHVTAYVRERLKNFWGGNDTDNEKREGLKFSRQHLLLKDGLGDQCRYILFLLVSPTIEDWRRLPLPGSLGFLLHGYRPLRLGMDFARGKAFGLARGT
jgi:hypothetical protein